MRRKICRDCTGEPPGELITSATALALRVAKARSSILATPPSVMPGRNGVTAPITPASRTTGTIAAPRRQRAGTSSVSLDHHDTRPSTRSLIASAFALNLPIFISYHVSVIFILGTPFALQSLSGCNEAAEMTMKIYLLILLIGALLTAIHFTSAP